jgi:hypothetical protein
LTTKEVELVGIATLLIPQYTSDMHKSQHDSKVQEDATSQDEEHFHPEIPSILHGIINQQTHNESCVQARTSHKRIKIYVDILSQSALVNVK